MTIQASAVRRVLTADQAKERDALLAVEQTGREALAEMRRLVGILRLTDDAPGLEPQPGLGQVPKLVAQARELGLAVELRVEGEPAPLPPGVDLTAYRLVQEGLTNARKHSNASRTDVRLRYDGRCHRSGGVRRRQGRGRGRRRRAGAGRHARASLDLSAASSKPARVPTAASGCGPACRCSRERNSRPRGR